MGRAYNNPPLIEAVCAFQFASSQPWDWTIPGLIYERIQEQFPYKEQINVIETKFDASEASILQQTQPRVRFLSLDRTGLIQIAPDTLSIHQLRPYDKWNNFKPRILKYLDLYCELAHPTNLDQVGLRYVNRIELPDTGVELEEYFQILPQIPRPVPQVFQSFLLQTEIPYNSPESALRIIFGTVKPESIGHSAYALDLDMFSKDKPAPLDQISQWLEAAHSRIEIAFDASFTEKTHLETFQEVNA